MATTLIKGGYILDPSLPLSQQDILIEDNLIVEVASAIDIQADCVINASGKVVMPGLISAHSHTSTVLFRGLADNLPGEAWLLYHHYAGMGKLSPRDLYVASAIGAIEMLKTGTTSIIEHGHVMGSLAGFNERVGAIARGLEDVGIRAVLAPMYSDVKFSERVPLYVVGKLEPELLATMDPFPPIATNDIIQALRNLAKNWLDRDSRISLCLGPSNPIGCSRELMGQTFELASEYDLAIHTHLLETKNSRVFSPLIVKYMAEMDWLGPQVSFAHGVWLDERDIKILAETGSNVVHNPISNMKLGSGIAHVQSMKANGLNVALGVDNAGGANDSQNMFEVMKYTALIHKLYGPPSNWLSVQDAFAMCLTNGARVLRKKVGSLQPGYLADLVILDAARLFVTQKENLVNQIVYADLGSSVQTVLVDGRIVVKDKEILLVSEEELYVEAKESAQRIYTDIPSLNKRLASTLNLLIKMSMAVADQQLPFNRLACL
jgi:cytosine/adenosine deaminase-related metal-dependent hydrolase